MSKHLLLITLGPVQDFIAQARRTRDLWYGSHILSELSRAAARTLANADAKLIFPFLEKGNDELIACLSPLREDKNKSPQNIANKILAEVPEGTNPEDLARCVRESVKTFWRDEIATPVKKDCADLLAKGIDAAWNEQIDTFLEFAATWLPLGDDNYKETRKALEQAISGRKLLRDFDVWKHCRGEVPQSSLDGARETVLAKQRTSRLFRRYRIADNEQLDAVGLVKRAGGKPDQFVPVVNVMLASWLQQASEKAPKELEALKTACEEIGLSSIRRDLPCVDPFPYYGNILFPSRWDGVFEELDPKEKLNTEDKQRIKKEAKEWGCKHVKPLLEKLSEPYPYVACLVADGDHVGSALDSLKSAGDHRTFSKALAGFASEARTIVEQKHLGSLVYAGGDDVLAFVALPEALQCADALRNAFHNAMCEACRLFGLKEVPTLSVGLGIGHDLESMGELLTFGRNAEKIAKIDRNALAVLVNKRSGGTHSWRAQWSDDPVALSSNAANLLQNKLSSRKVYEIANILRRLPKPNEAREGDWSNVLALEVRLVLSRVEGGKLEPEDVGLELDDKAKYADLRNSVNDWVQRMLIAKTFVQATRPGNPTTNTRRDDDN